MIVDLKDLKKDDWVHVVFPNGDRVLGKVSAAAPANSTEPQVFVDPPGCLWALPVRFPMKADRLDTAPDPATLPTLAQQLATVPREA